MIDAAPVPVASQELIRECATALLEQVSELSSAMAAHLHTQVNELRGLDSEALAETSRSCEANIREICTMLRCGLPASAQETPAEALAYGRAMRARGIGLTPVRHAYALGVAMLGAVAAGELERRNPNQAVRTAALSAMAGFVDRYIERVLQRIAEEYGSLATEDTAPLDPARRDSVSAAAAQAFLTSDPSRGRRLAGSARAAGEQSLIRFQRVVTSASSDPGLSRRLALAGVSVSIRLADESDLALTLLFDQTPVQVAPGSHAADVELVIPSTDLDRLASDEFNLAMAIARGRVEVHGPVRRFLRIMPIIRQLPDPVLAASNGNGSRITVAEHDADEEESKFDPATRALLDRAHDYRYHQGALHYEEERPGNFWSIECRGVYKSFGKNRILNGLDVGIPEGMITVVLGPSGTGKSVLISHLIGLMFPDQGEILVHGRNVADLRLSELLELRQKFGILFQDGALFGSMNVFDNVAFPLRQHTDKSEREIAEIVNQRLAEVGLAAAGDRMPGELSGGMRKRAGFARALVLDPEIVMFDEPDSGLDPVRTALLCELIQQMHAEHGGTYIVVTHDIASARKIAEYLVVLWKGRIVQAGDRDDMFTSDNPFVRQFLTGQARGPLGME